MERLHFFEAVVFEVLILIVAVIAGFSGHWNIFAPLALAAVTAPLWYIAAVVFVVGVDVLKSESETSDE